MAEPTGEPVPEDAVRRSQEYLHAFIRTAQYIPNLTTRQDILSETGRVLISFFKADLVGFFEPGKDGRIEGHHWILPDGVVENAILNRETETIIAGVLETGFLAAQQIDIPEPVASVFLPIIWENQTAAVMLVGHRTSDPLPKELLNIYLAVAGLVSNAITGADEEFKNIAARKRAEEALKDARAQLAFLVSNTPVVLYRCSASGDFNVTFISDNVQLQLGYEAHEFMDDPAFWPDHIHPDDRERVFGGLPRVIEKGTTTTEYRLLAKDGTYHWIRDEVRAVRDASGQPVEYLGYWIDITDRKRAEAALSAIAREWEITFNATSDAICLIDADQKIQRCNIQMSKILGGISQEKIVGMPCWAIVHKTTGPIPDCPFVSTKNTLYRTKIELPAGELWFEVTADPILDSNGKFTGAVHIMRDITARKLAEEALRESEERVRTIIEQSPLSIEVMSPDGRTVQVNPAFVKLWGVTLENLIDYNMLKDEQLTRLGIMPYIQRGFSGEAVAFPPVQYDGSKTLGFGEKKWVQGNIYPVRDAAGTIRNVILVHEDISDRKLAEEEIRKAHQVIMEHDRFLQRLIDTIPNPIFYKDKNGIYTGSNTAFEGYIGLSKDQLVGKSVYDIAPKDLADIYYASDRKLLNNPGTQIYESRVKYADGSIHDVIFNKATFTDLGGNVEGLVGVILDITERKQAEEALRESEATLHSILQGSPTLQFVIDKDHRVISWNKAIEEYSGIKEGEVLGTRNQWKAFYDTERPILADLLLDEKVEQIPEWYQGTLNNSQFVEGAYEATDFFPNMGESGKWLYFTAAPVRNVKGEIIGAVETLEDITKRKLAEEALRESERRFREIFNNVNDAIELHELRSDGLPGKYLEVNDVTCRMLQYSREELLRHSPLDFTTDYHNRPASDIGKELLTLGHSQFETEHRRKDGTIVPVEINAHVIVLYEKTMVLSVVRDITERKLAEEALRQVNKKLNLLSSITRHDINNQLTVLLGYLELSKDSLDDVAKISEYLIKEEHAANAIQRQIVFTKEYQDLGVKDPVWQNVEATIKKSLTVLPIRDIRVIAEVNDLEVYADLLFEKVFYNLIDNALRYGGLKMTMIRITSQEAGQGLVISVEDDGAGISGDDKKRLFERGFGHHTGLGLFLSREILAITGITINETGEPDRGARFEILVPKGGYRITGDA